MSDKDNEKNIVDVHSQLKCIIEPEAIAVIGASDNLTKWGGKVTANLKKSFNGKIFPVNPGKDEILGLKCYESVLDIPSEYDVKTAIITIPIGGVLRAVEECGARGVKGIIMITAGFAETGAKEGKDLQKKLMEIIDKYGMRLLGPNCLGLINPHIKMNASNVGGGEKIKPGNVVIITQSGTIALDAGHKARKMGLKVRAMISIGNGVNINVEDLTEYSINDLETDVIAIYSEGIKDGGRFMKLAQSANKHIIALKVGRTETGAKAASSHTASMAGADEVYTAAFKQAGVIRVENITELLGAALAFSNQAVPKGSGIAIVSNGGGPLIMIADAIEKSGINVQEFGRETQEKIKEFLPAHITHTGNPLDIGGITTKETFRDVVKILMEDNNISGIIVTYVQEPEEPEILLDIYKNSPKPIIFCWVGNDGGETRKELEELGVPVFDDPDFAAKMMAYMIKRGEYLRKKAVKRENMSKKKSPICRIPTDVFNVWTALERHNIPILPMGHAKTAEHAARFVKTIDFPVAMKIDSPDISHKSDVGGVVTNLNSRDEVEKAFNCMIETVKNKLPKARIEGVAIQKMAERGGIEELIVGAKRDPSFGPVIIFGLGGTRTELLKEFSMKVSPVGRETAREMIMETKLSPYFSEKGFREKRADIEAVIDAIVAMSKIMEENDNIREIEINPLIVYEKGAVAVDARMFVKED